MFLHQSDSVLRTLNYLFIDNYSHSVSLDMMNISQAKKAQGLATDLNYRTVLHEYTTLPTDMNVAWAKKAYDQHSEVCYVV